MSPIKSSISNADLLVERVRNYLGNGGLFNPELMEHDKVRQLIMDLRDHVFDTKSALTELAEIEEIVHKVNIVTTSPTLEQPKSETVEEKARSAANDIVSRLEKLVIFDFGGPHIGERTQYVEFIEYAIKKHFSK